MTMVSAWTQHPNDIHGPLVSTHVCGLVMAMALSAVVCLISLAAGHLVALPFISGFPDPFVRPSQRHHGKKDGNHVDPHFVDPPKVSEDDHQSFRISSSLAPLSHCGSFPGAADPLHEETPGIQRHHSSGREPGCDQIDQEVEPDSIGGHDRTVH